MANSYSTIAINWPNGWLEIPAGTPLDSSGNVVNDGTAAGIVYETVRYPVASANCITAGQFDEETNRGKFAISDEVKRALSAIEFTGSDGERHPVTSNPIPTTDNVATMPTVDENGNAYVEGEGGAALPEVTAADNGKVLSVVNGAWDKVAAPSAPQIEIAITWSQWNSAKTADLDVLSKITFSVNDLAAVAAGNGKCIINTGESIIDAHTDLSMADVVDDRGGSGEFRVLFAGDSLHLVDLSEIDGGVERAYLFVQYYDGAFKKALLRRIPMNNAQ